MDRVDQWLADDSRWFSENRELLEVVLDCFLKSGEWPEVAVLRRLLFQRGTKGIDVQVVANAKPAIPAQLTMAIQERISLAARHLQHMPRSAGLLDLLVRATAEAVKAYASNEDQPAVRYDNPAFFQIDSETVIRFVPFVTADYPNPFGRGNYGDEWVLQVNEALIPEFEGVKSTEDYIERQVAIIRNWVERTTPIAGAVPPTEEDQNVALLKEQIDAANGDVPDDFTKWRERSGTALRIGLGQDHPLVSAFGKVHYAPMAFSPDSPRQVFTDAQRSGVRRAVAILEAAVLELEMRDRTDGATKVDEAVESMSNVVFIVHGHDTGTLNEVAITVIRLTGQEAVILHEQPNRGQTIIEKFERHASDAAFVVVLATADDFGRPKTGSELQPRARQNVVFELGYFIGALGRDKVAVLHDEDVELPSDMAGVLYIPNDASGGWQLKLAREMRAAGLDVDTNRL